MIIDGKPDYDTEYVPEKAKEMKVTIHKRPTQDLEDFARERGLELVVTEDTAGFTAYVGNEYGCGTTVDEAVKELAQKMSRYLTEGGLPIPRITVSRKYDEPKEETK